MAEREKAAAMETKFAAEKVHAAAAAERVKVAAAKAEAREIAQAKLVSEKERAVAVEREKAAAAEAEAREITQVKLAPITNDTAKSDDSKAPAARSARDAAAGTHALGDAVMVVRGDGRRSHEGIVRFVGATRFAPRVWGWRVAL